MAKTEDQDIETVHFPALDPAKAADQLRVVAEKVGELSTGALVKFASGAEDAQKMLKSIFENTKAVSNELSLKTMGALRANAEADLSHLQALVGAKLPSQVIALQSNFLRKRVEMCVEQAKEFQALSTKGVADVTKPIKDALEKALTDVKAA
ncbi:phasin [Mesorhizobium huakuii]|uniref:Phasin n=1 Tax=Mesorhizobium huakuii TaxID=28104 RepID=A0A7G6T4W1_9HYPH|nr:phasin [Mesorhizobium huakuii]QND61793.1 phasin [Mesorhizobium huakuii]QND69244.1 phasin [Mesorhizobium loti]